MFLDQKENFNFDQPTTFQINPNPLQNGLQITSKIKQEKRVAKFSPYKKQVFEAPFRVSQKEATKSTWLLNWCSQVGVRCLLMLDKSEPNLLRSSNQHFLLYHCNFYLREKPKESEPLVKNSTAKMQKTNKFVLFAPLWQPQRILIVTCRIILVSQKINNYSTLSVSGGSLPPPLLEYCYCNPKIQSYWAEKNLTFS